MRSAYRKSDWRAREYNLIAEENNETFILSLLAGIDFMLEQRPSAGAGQVLFSTYLRYDTASARA
jgi:hypothetical protein